MTNAVSTVGGKSIISSGTFVGSNFDELLFYPFDDDDSFTIKFRFVFDDEVDRATTTIYNAGDGVEIVMKKKWIAGNLTSFSRQNTFAEDPLRKYYIMYLFQTSGVRTDFVYSFSYTIYELTKP